MTASTDARSASTRSRSPSDEIAAPRRSWVSILPSTDAATLISTYGLAIGRSSFGAEPVADRGLGQDPTRTARFSLELAPQLGDEGPQIVQRVLVAGPQRRAQQVPVGQYPVGGGRHHPQQPVLGRGEVNLAIVDDQ